MVDDSDPFEAMEVKRHQQETARSGLREQLRGRESVGRAFRVVCDAGCDAKWLERTLLSAPLFPWKRSKRRFKNSGRAQVDRIIAELECAARELQTHVRTLIVTGVKDWPVPPDELPSTLRGIASCLRKAMASPRRLREITAADRVPYIINTVRKQTGRPHYAEMATLLGAAYNLPEMNEDQLKVFVRRSRARSRSGNARSAK